MLVELKKSNLHQVQHSVILPNKLLKKQENKHKNNFCL